MNQILIVGILRNCSSTLEKDIATLSSAFADFEVSFFFVESDSQDSTVLLLERLKFELNSFSFVSLGNVESVIPNRIERISHCRNVYLEELRTRTHTTETEFTVIVDMDGINQGLSKIGVESSFNLANWSVCCANQRGPYYDIYALRATDWNVHNLSDSYRMYLVKYKFHAFAFYFSVIHKMLKFRGSIPIEVDSAFGGLAIYRTSSIINLSYSPRNMEGEIECEHVSLHRSIRNEGGRIIINPKLINSGVSVNARRAFLKFFGICLLGKRYYYLRGRGF